MAGQTPGFSLPCALALNLNIQTVRRQREEANAFDGGLNRLLRIWPGSLAALLAVSANNPLTPNQNLPQSRQPKRDGHWNDEDAHQHPFIKTRKIVY